MCRHIGMKAAASSLQLDIDRLSVRAYVINLAVKDDILLDLAVFKMAHFVGARDILKTGILTVGVINCEPNGN
jgi:hypothetical protein